VNPPALRSVQEISLAILCSRCVQCNRLGHLGPTCISVTWVPHGLITRTQQVLMVQGNGKSSARFTQAFDGAVRGLAVGETTIIEVIAVACAPRQPGRYQGCTAVQGIFCWNVVFLTILKSSGHATCC